MQILDGKKAAQAIKDELKIEVAQLVAEGKKIPHLAAILVGNSGASETYVAAKIKACEEVGFKSTLITLSRTIPTLLIALLGFARSIRLSNLKKSPEAKPGLK